MAVDIISARTTSLSFLWLCLLVCTGCFLVAAVLGLVFRKATWWGVALGLVVTEALLGVTIAILDHMGYAR
jgi:Na+/proline symporter